MGVASGHIDGGVSDQITHDKGIDSAVDQYTGVGMSEGVKAQTGNIVQPLFFASSTVWNMTFTDCYRLLQIFALSVSVRFRP